MRLSSALRFALGSTPVFPANPGKSNWTPFAGRDKHTELCSNLGIFAAIGWEQDRPD